MRSVGVVGLGAMGGRIADRLLAARFDVHGTNRTAAKAARFVEHGLLFHETPRRVAEATEVVISMVSDDAALEAVTAGPDGILAGLAPGQIYVDMSTVSPELSTEIAEQVRSLGAHMLDAPVSGSVRQAASGTLTIMAGGDERAFEQVAPLLRYLGRTVTRVGDSGQGLWVKLAINVSLAAQTLAFAEGLLLAVRGGLDPKLAADVMSASAIGSPAVQARAQLMLELPEHAWFDIRLMQKDIRLALREGRDRDVPLPAAETANDVLELALALGYGERDIAGLYEVLGRVSETSLTTR